MNCKNPTKKLLLILSLISFQELFCMKRDTSEAKIEEPKSKKQKRKEDKDQKTVELEKLTKKLDQLSFIEIKKWQGLKKFADLLVAYQTDHKICNPLESLFSNVKHALISPKPVKCNLCSRDGYNLFFLYKTGSSKVNFVLCDCKLDRECYFKVRLLTWKELKKILEIVNSNNIELGYSSIDDTRFTMRNQVKLKNLIPSERKKYLYSKMVNENVMPGTRLIFIGANDAGSPFHKLSWELIFHIIDFLVNAEANDPKNLEKFLEL